MLKSERIKKEIEILPSEMLDEVERFIKSLKTHKKPVIKKSLLLYKLADIATDAGLPQDFSIQHDHYLYGLPKR
ncbi:MAG TPA: hypothetical protein DCQ99_02660 [Nitrospinae bacterium]|nr:hypothetical protein [Nitrospinota bacterium]HBA26050.1 hypothetical protein [Nitrospinota bacterium]HBA26056.1 hypothetical protein [Nitrospinota bacterium]